MPEAMRTEMKRQLDAIIRPAQVIPVSIWMGANTVNATPRDWAAAVATSDTF